MKNFFLIKLTYSAFFLLGLLTSAYSGVSAEERPPLIIFAASSLTDVLADLNIQHAHMTSSKPAILSFGASATMARQIEAGAPADIFISANDVWTTRLLEHAKAQVVLPLIGNQMVLVGNHKLPKNLNAIRTYLVTQKLAVADPALAPAGSYAMAFLDNLYPAPAAKPQLVFSQNARQTLRLSEATGLPAIVYRSDALASGRFETIIPIAPEVSGEIIYQAALITADQRNRKLLNFLKSSAAIETWAKYGFSQIASD